MGNVECCTNGRERD
jgi:hypothetical protein